MTRQEFVDAIKKLGWSVQTSCNGLNDKLVSPSGAITDIRVNDDCLEPYSNNLYGGESFNLKAKWYFKDAEYSEQGKYVAIDHLLIMNNNVNK